MAAPIKSGLDYFPFDVDLLSDRKLRRCKLKYGYMAAMIYIALLSILYKDKGYYIDYSEKHKDDVVWEVLELMQGKYQPAAETVMEIIEDLVACELFSGDQFKSETITSIRAQKVYYRSTVDRKAVDIDFDKWLLPEDEMRAISEKSIILRNFINQANNPVNRAKNEVNQTNNPQSKVKESKVKESKVKKTKDSGVPPVWFPTDEKLNQTVNDFIEFRDKIKAHMTDHAVELMIDKLNQMTSDNNEKIEILNQSIMNGWKGIFPLEKQSNKKQGSGRNGWIDAAEL